MTVDRKIDPRVQRMILMAAALLDTIRETGDLGAPAGHLYAAVMGRISIDQFEGIMATLTGLGKIRKSNHTYYAVHN